MSYKESKDGDLITVVLTCDARKGKGICENTIEVTMQNREWVNELLFAMGWRILRGHKVCSSCLAKKRVTFPRRRSG